MSIACLILGTSGSGKTSSLRNMDPAHTLLIQPIKKPLPFKAPHWKLRTPQNPSGNVFQTDDPAKIVAAMFKSHHEVVVVDDLQAILVNELMSRSTETGYQKFSDIGRHTWDLLNAAGALAVHRRVYIMAHTTTDEFGAIRMKTVGKMVDEKIVPEGYFSIVLRTEARDGAYKFSTQTNGQDCVKSPIGMFSDRYIDNDLAEVDAAIFEYYGLQAQAA